MKRFKITYKLFIITFLFSIMLSTAVYAEGNGESGGKDPKPLKFVSCTLESGGSINSKDGIGLNAKFKLQFDKNVVNMLVWENNRHCISLFRDDNKRISIVTTKIDDTVDFDNRQNIYVRPVDSLEAGRSYYIKVSPSLLAKNGKSTLGETTGGEGVSVSFKTKGEEKAKDPEKDAEKPKADNQSVSSNKPEKSSDTVNKNNSLTSEGAINKNSAGKATEAKDKETSIKDTSKENKETKPDEVKNVEDKTPSNESQTSSVVEKSNELNKSNNNPKEINTGKKLTTGNYIIIGAGIIIICWVAIEFFVRRKRK